MADHIRIEFNTDRFNRAIAKYAFATQKNFEQAFTNTVLAAEGRIKEFTPVRTGRLRSSIHTQFNNRLPDYMEATISTPVEYAPFVEKGTSRMQGHHMFERGFRNTLWHLEQQFRFGG